MIVDPNTGMPVEDDRPGTQSMSGEYGSTLGAAYGVDMPLYYDAMAAIPPAWAAASWNMGRVRNTILNNKTAQTGFARGSRAPWKRGANAGGLRQTFSPFRFGSLADLSNIDPDAFGTTRPGRGLFRGTKGADGTRTRRGYTPFNFMADQGNNFMASKWAGKFRVEKGVRAFAPGTLGTMSTMASVGSGISEKRMANVIGAANRFNTAKNSLPAGVLGPRLGQNIPMPSFISSASGRGTYASTVLGGSRLSKAKYSGRAAGFFQGSQAARLGTLQEAKFGLMATDGGGYFGSALREGAEKFASGSRFARFAGSRSAALGMKAVPYVGQAMIAYDITKFLGKSVGRGLRLGVDGIKSAQGDLNKPGPFGMGYKDNSVAATSRQRGVMAISNSRLNARSFLGQEGAFMYQNFG